MPSKHFTAQDKALLVKKFKESNLERHDFCKLNNISYSSLYRWLKDNINKKKTNTFTPITLPSNIINNVVKTSAKPIITTIGSIKIKLPNGAEVEIPETYNIANIAKCISFLKEV